LTSTEIGRYATNDPGHLAVTVTVVWFE